MRKVMLVVLPLLCVSAVSSAVRDTDEQKNPVISVEITTPLVVPVLSERISSPEVATVGTTALVDYLKTGNSQLRAASARELGNRNVVTAIDDLKRLLSDPDRYVQVTAAIALQKMGDYVGTPMLRKEVTSGGPFAMTAARYLMMAGDETGLELIKKDLQNPVAAYRNLAIAAISYSKNEELVHSTLMAGLEEKDALTRSYCIRRLGRLGTQRSMAALSLLYPKLNNPSDRVTAIEGASESGLWDAIPFLLKGLDDVDSKVRMRAFGRLNMLTKQNKIADVKNPEKAKQVSQEWNKWWAENKSKYPSGGKSDAEFLKNLDKRPPI